MGTTTHRATALRALAPILNQELASRSATGNLSSATQRHVQPRHGAGGVVAGEVGEVAADPLTLAVFQRPVVEPIEHLTGHAAERYRKAAIGVRLQPENTPVGVT